MKICGLFLLLLLALPAQARDEDVVRVKSNLVNIDVIVKDKKDKYVSDLKAEDFTITENGVAQKIEFFDAPLSRTDSGKPGEQRATTTAPPDTEIIAPGRYQAMIEAKDMVTRTSSKQEASFEIVP